MEISVIIPAYNVERKLITRCIDSLLKQDFKDFEIIIINDGSKKEYSDILLEIQKSFPIVKVINQENMGVSSARNTGTRHAIGNYICYVDADDMVTPSYLSESLKIAKEKNADVVMGGNSYIGVNKKDFNKPLNTTLYTETDIESLKKYMCGNRLLYFEENVYLGQGPWNRLIKSDLAKKIQFNTSLKIGEDIVWNFDLLNHAKRVCIVNKCWYLYYINPVSASRKYRSDAIEESRNSLNTIKKYINLSDDQQYKSYCTRCISDIKRIYLTYYSSKTVTSNDNIFSSNIYYSQPWSECGSFRYYKLCSIKEKFVFLLYKTHCLMLYYRLKDMWKKASLKW